MLEVTFEIFLGSYSYFWKDKSLLLLNLSMNIYIKLLHSSEYQHIHQNIRVYPRSKQLHIRTIMNYWENIIAYWEVIKPRCRGTNVVCSTYSCVELGGTTPPKFAVFIYLVFIFLKNWQSDYKLGPHKHSVPERH